MTPTSSNASCNPTVTLVLCQYRDITERSQRKLELERRNRELYEIQKAAFIGRWVFDTATREFGYAGHTGIMCKTDEQAIPLDAYLRILPEEEKYFLRTGSAIYGGFLGKKYELLIRICSKDKV